ncbi:MAG: twin-arginine translocation signal domain-containing protein, partial [Desulfobacterales bacterium]
MSKANTNPPNEEQYKDQVTLNRRTLLKATATAAAAAAAGALSAGKLMAYDAPEAVKKSLEKTGRVRLPFGQAERNWLANIVNWYEFPTRDPEVLEVWAYCDKLSYAPGDEVALHVN